MSASYSSFYYISFSYKALLGGFLGYTGPPYCYPVSIAVKISLMTPAISLYLGLSLFSLSTTLSFKESGNSLFTLTTKDVSTIFYSCSNTTVGSKKWKPSASNKMLSRSSVPII